MPNAPTHDFITIASSVVMAPVALNSGLPDMSAPNVVVLVGSYLLSGLLFSPDLDVRSTPYRRWRGMRWVWLPYQKMVPHRSWVSHSFLFGPILRVLYFAGIMALLALIGLGVLNLFVPVDPSGVLRQLTATVSGWIEAHPGTLAYAMLGFILGGAAHTLADLVYSGIKRRLRRL